VKSAVEIFVSVARASRMAQSFYGQAAAAGGGSGTRVSFDSNKWFAAINCSHERCPGY